MLFILHLNLYSCLSTWEREREAFLFFIFWYECVWKIFICGIFSYLFIYLHVEYLFEIKWINIYLWSFWKIYSSGPHGRGKERQNEFLYSVINQRTCFSKRMVSFYHFICRSLLLWGDLCSFLFFFSLF